MIKKTSLALLLGLLMILFAGTDFILNRSPQGSAMTEVMSLASPDDYPNLTQKLLESDPQFLAYTIAKRFRTTELFEKFDLSPLKELRLYRNELVQENKIFLVLYELQGPKNQGGMTYLKVKLALRDQINATEALNENNEFGQSSFYFNDLNSPDIAFLLTQVGDHLYAFEFNQKNREDFELVKAMIKGLMSPFNS